MLQHGFGLFRASMPVMTSLSLLLWIVSGIALQLAIFLGISFWGNYESKRNRKEHDDD